MILCTIFLKCTILLSLVLHIGTTVLTSASLYGNAFIITFSPANIEALSSNITALGYRTIPIKAFQPQLDSRDHLLRFCIGRTTVNASRDDRITPSNQIARICSHRGIWEIISSDPSQANDDWSLVFEEDAIMSYQEHNPRDRLQIFLLRQETIVKGFVYLGLCRNDLCSHAYAVTKTFASTMHNQIMCPYGSCQYIPLEYALKEYLSRTGSRLLLVESSTSHSTNEVTRGLFYRSRGAEYGFDGPTPIVSTLHTCYHHNWGGRLGNMMSQYAALVGICVKNYMHPYSCVHGGPLDSIRSLESAKRPVDVLYHLFSLPNVTCPWNKAVSKELVGYNNRVELAKFDLAPTTRILGFFQSYKYFYPHAEASIRKLFTFPPSIVRQALNFFENLKTTLQMNNHFTCVHVRRGDKVSKVKKPDHAWALSEHYYLKAMRKFLEKDGNSSIVYFVGGHVPGKNESETDKDWVLRHLAQEFPLQKHVFTFELSDIVSLYALSRCDNIVVGLSTFSWWSAFLAGHSNVIVPTFNSLNIDADRYLPHWTVQQH